MADSHKDLPELPGLESVSAGGWSWMGVYAVLGLALGAFVGAGTCLAYWVVKNQLTHTRPQLPELVAVGSAGIAAVLIITAAVVLRTEFVFRTDRDGLTARGLRHSRFLPWREVAHADVRKRWTGERIYVVGTDRETVKMSPSEGVGYAFAASVWQHLRRFGKADDSLLTEDARSFWIRIPDDIPQEVDWHNPKAPSWPLMGAVALVMLLVVLVWHFREFLFGEWHASALFHAFSGAVGGGLAAFSRRLFTVSRCSVRAGYFEARTAIGPVFIEWRNVRAAGWGRGGLSIRGARLRTRADIPVSLDDEQSVRAVLALVRRLRTLDHLPPVSIPDPLRSSPWLQPAAETGAPPDYVEMRQPAAVRLTLFAGMLMSAGLLVLASLMPILPLNAIARLALRIAAALNVAVGFFMLRGRSLRADCEDITLKTPFGSKSVRWSQVAAYIVESDGHLPEDKTHILKDSTGRNLLSFVPFGTAEDQQKLAAILEFRLGAVKRAE